MGEFSKRIVMSISVEFEPKAEFDKSGNLLISGRQGNLKRKLSFWYK